GVPPRTGRRDDRVAVVDRLLVARPLRLGSPDRPARVLLAVRDQRPAVVPAGQDPAQPVAAARPVLDGPEPALWVERHRLDVAVAERPDLRPRILLADERVVLRHGAVRRDAQHLAEMVVELLRVYAHGRVEAVAGGDVQHAVG